MGIGERRLWWALWPALAAYALTGALVQARAGGDLSVALELLAASSFAVAGLLAWRLRPGNHLGRLMIVVTVVWCIGSYMEAQVDVVQSFAVAFASLEAIAIAHVALAYPEGRLPGRAERVLIAAGYAAASLTGIAILLTFNPRRDFQCDCPSAPLGVFKNPSLVRFALDSTDKIAGAVVLGAVLLLVRRLHRANLTERWLLAPLWVAAVVAGVAFIGRTTAAVVSLSDASIGRLDDVLNVMTMLIPGAFLAGLLRRRYEPSPLGDLVVALGGGTSVDVLQRALADALHDPSVEVAYWLPDRGSYVDASGRGFALPADGGPRAATVIERDGDRLAALVHDRALLENPRLIEAATAAAGLALDNERLQAELRAQIVEVGASRTRIIRAGDDARRRIERDLHDGAQQRLLASALSLRMASDALAEDADPATRHALESAADEALLAVAELRELAQGIHPAVLTEQGLGAAVEVLAERSPVAVAVDVPADRHPAAVEAAAYFVVSEALANVAKHAHAQRVVVRARRQGDTLVVDVTDDGAGGATAAGGSGLAGMHDRVAALGGRLDLHSPIGDGTRLRIELPCS